MSKKNDLRRLADAAERIANALDKLTDVTNVSVSQRPELMAAPVDGGKGDVFHALYRSTRGPVCGVDRRSARNTGPADLQRMVPESRIPAGHHCCGNGCARAFLRSSRSSPSQYLTTADVEEPDHQTIKTG